MMDICKLIGQRIRDLRKKMGLTQEEMANRCGLHWTYIGGLERGERNPTLTTLNRVADGLSVPLHHIIGRSKAVPLGTREKKEGKLLKLLRKKDEHALELLIKIARSVVQWKER